MPEAAGHEGAASNSLNQDDISKLFGDTGQNEKEGGSQNREAEPSQDLDHGPVTPVKYPADAEGLGGEDHMGQGESFSGVDGSENIEDDEVEIQETEELLAQLEILEDEPVDDNSHNDAEENVPDRDDVSTRTDSHENPSSEKGDTTADKKEKGNSETVNGPEVGDQDAEEPEGVTEEDEIDDDRDHEGSVEEHGVDAESDKASITEAGDPEGQEAADHKKDRTSAENPLQEQKDNELSEPNSDQEPLSTKGEREEDENLEADTENHDKKAEEEEDRDVPEVVNEGRQNEDDIPLKEDDEHVEDEHRPKRGKRSLMLLIGLLSCVIVMAGMAGWVLYRKRYVPESTKKKVLAPVQQRNVSVGEMETGLPQPRPSHVARGPATLVARLESRLQEAADLRDELLIKAGEIDQLKGHFSESIAKTEKEILQEKKAREINSYLQAMNNKKVELGLRTIQRREAYIRQLDQPSEWLEGGSQELLYVRRKTMIEMEASKIAGDIDLERLIADLGGVIQKNRHGMNSLTVDMGKAKLHCLETIWTRLTEADNGKGNGETNTKKRVPNGPPFITGNRDNEIWQELCGGNYARKGELTELSVPAAKCLSRIEVSDLFLNGLIRLSPEAAKHLMKWKGDWLCLNGLKQVLPETGKSLFQWPGKVISLNGLSRFPPELAPLLLKWQGTQLELMGLEPLDDIGQLAGIKALAQWEESGGKLYVPGNIRKQIEDIMGRSG
ncbi:MAG: hypothetical protein SWH78_03080 [Thermodesulfobacteriota bacterium]|nr:hypothetical protein [Thermodesulfobacteriota bacterium]